MTVSRWTWELDEQRHIISMVRGDDGEWARWSDCERLLKRIEELQEAITKLRTEKRCNAST